MQKKNISEPCEFSIKHKKFIKNACLLKCNYISYFAIKLWLLEAVRENYMKILVTGGLGYIGSHTVVELLQKNHDVIVIDNLYNSSLEILARINKITGKTPVFYQGDMGDKALIRRVFAENGTINACIHFAGYKVVNESLEKPLEYYTNNISGTLNLLTVLGENNCKNFIFSSSASVYGDTAPVPISEETPKGVCSNPYAWSKSFIDQILFDLFQSDKTWDIVSLRYFNPVGAHPSYLIGEINKSAPTNLMPHITLAALGKEKELSIFGSDYPTKDGTGIRDFIHVVDLAKGHVAALDILFDNDKHLKNDFHLYNLGTGKGYSVLEMVQTFEAVNKVKVPYKFAPRRPADIAVSFADVNKIYRDIGWKSELTLEDMCKDAYQFTKRYYDSLK